MIGIKQPQCQRGEVFVPRFTSTTRIHTGIRRRELGGSRQTFHGRMTRISPGVQPNDSPLTWDRFHLAMSSYQGSPSQQVSCYSITLGFIM